MKKNNQNQQKTSQYYLGKFLCNFYTDEGFVQRTQANKKFKINILSNSNQKIQFLKPYQKRLYVIGGGDPQEGKTLICKVSKGDEEIYKLYNKYGYIEHIFDELWYFLISADYVKLIVNFKQITGEQKKVLTLAEISVYFTEKAINDEYELKILRYNGKQANRQRLEDDMTFSSQYQEEIKMEYQRFARLSLLLMFDFMNIVVETPAIIKSDKQFKIFFSQYGNFNSKQNSYSLNQLMKSYHRPIIENQNYFDEYINNKSFYNKLFPREKILQLALFNDKRQGYLSNNKPYKPQIEKIHPLFHIQVQRFLIAFYEKILNFIKKTQNQADKQQQQPQYSDQILKSILFQKPYYIDHEFQFDNDFYEKQHSDLIDIMYEIQKDLREDNLVKLLCDQDNRIYEVSKNKIVEYFYAQQVVSPYKNDEKDYQQYQQLKKVQDSYFDELKLQQNQQQDMQQQNQNAIYNVDIELKEYETPKQMLSKLKSHQKQALYWMLIREGHIYHSKVDQKQKLSPLWQQVRIPNGEHLYINIFTAKIKKEFVPIQEIKGGILADDMGLGKTVMALALILETQKKGQQTLIVVPKSVLLQWEKEVKNHSQPNSLSVLVYYKRQSRSKSICLSNYDIILTTYTILSSDYQRWKIINKSQKKQKTNNRKRKNSNFEEEYDEDSEDVSDNFEQSDNYYRDAKEIQFESEEESSQESIKKKLTLKQQQKAILENNLFKQNYHRVILDEAHNIKTRSTLQTRSAVALQCQFRWCLTGTPMQNKHDDLFSLLQFLKVETFSEYFWWNAYVNKEENEEDQQKILAQILQPLILRRTKYQSQIEGLQLVTENIHWVELNQKERQLYKKLLSGSQTLFNRLVENNNNFRFVHIFQIINKLRLACDHPQLALKDINLDQTPLDLALKKIDNFFQQKAQEGSKITEEYKQNLIDNIKNGEITDCSICIQNQITVYNLSSCGHIYCKDCFTEAVNKLKNCPSCRTKLTPQDLIEVVVENKTAFEELKLLSCGLSSKIEAVLKETKIVKQNKEKVLIFTQWIEMIGLLENLFKENGIIARRITGQMTADQREEVIQSFKQQQDITALVLSLRSTSTGLNLTMATNVFIVDPWWNPAIEDQAIGRVDRIGQEHQVKVIRFLCKNSIEEQMNLLHKKKKMHIKRTLSNNGQKKEEELEDFKFLLFQE